MGSGMARSLARAGHDVVVWNRTVDRAGALQAPRIAAAASVSEAVGGADAVVTALFDAKAVEAVSGELTAALGADAVWIQASTVGPDEARRIGAAANGRMVDAPVLGTKKPADEGTLVVLAAGPEALLARARPVFDAIGLRTLVVGPELGQASALKLACNAWVATLTVATAQSIAMAEAFGVEPEQFLNAIEGGPVDSPYAHIKGATMLAGDYTTSFAVDGVVKDINLMITAAEAAGFPTEVLSAIRAQFERTASEGHGGADMAAVRRAFP